MKRLTNLTALVLLSALAFPAVVAQGMPIDTRRDFEAPLQRMLPIQLGPEDGPLTMADNGHGLRLAAWAYQSGLEVDIALSQRVGNTWTPVELFGQGNGLIDREPDLAFLPDGRPVLIWVQFHPRSGHSDVVFSLLTAEGWRAPERVNAPGTSASAPHLVPTLGQLSVVFANGSGQLVTRAFSTNSGEGGYRSESGSNGPDPMPNISVPPEKDPSEFPSPRQLSSLDHL